MLKTYRRHLKTCRSRKKGRGYKSCECPFWVDGMLDGRRIRHSLNTANVQEAGRKTLEIEAGHSAVNVPVSRAFHDYIEDCESRELEPSTIDIYTRVLESLVHFCKARAISWVRSLDIPRIKQFLKQLDGSASSKKTYIEVIRTFLNFCVDMDWCEKNAAARVKKPKLDNEPVIPFTKEDHDAIVAACNHYPTKNAYGHDARRRMLAFVLALRYTALRISDVVKLKPSRISAKGNLLIRTTKTSTPVWLPLPPELLDALKAIQIGDTYYFGTYRERMLPSTDNWERLFRNLLKLAKVTGHPHMYRHMAAIELLENGVLVEHVAAILGNSPEVVTNTMRRGSSRARKHWSQQ